MAAVMETLMLIAFGISWPVNVLKSWRAKTAKGKSIFFSCLIFTGYIFGILGKLMGPSAKASVIFFYALNLFMVGADIILYCRNKRLDEKAGEREVIS